ncbi:hypothetical protein ACQUJS_13375 [Ralstonia pseudosolanacearum]|uniref:Transmembrane protein n=1 Tax=Ralstonia solanacearum TaxID=305 RepID=A0A0S4TL27_RALSL|nr:hypothetical protein [Ralstonia pseudosolanacearum]OAI81112.1 hypothetical protein RSP799_04065 [Ralstonia solanacearum]QCX48819.1 hypothetical protein E7Z57_06720 [Ralstonia pseudosolanacearum]CUV10812.1 conserved protein of unknown function [Ralstonia solanacearum]
MQDDTEIIASYGHPERWFAKASRKRTGRELAITALHWEVGLAIAAVPLTALLAYEFLGLMLSVAFPHTHG